MVTLLAAAELFSGSFCFWTFLMLCLVAWVLNKREKDRQAEAQRQLPRHAAPSLGRNLAVGVAARVLTNLVTGWLGGRHHGHHQQPSS